MAHQQRERRQAPRIAVGRRAMFVAEDGSTLLQAGVVTDMGKDGLHLRTRQPAPVGTVIEIEMDPRDGSPQSGPIIARGRVVRVQELADGEYSVGVRLRYRSALKTPAQANKEVQNPASSAARRAAVIQHQRIPSLGWRQVAYVVIVLFVVGVALLWSRHSAPSQAAVNIGQDSQATTLSEAIADRIRRPRSANRSPLEERQDRGYSVQPLVPSKPVESRGVDRVS